MSTITVLYRSITEADVEQLLNDPRSSAMSRGDQFEVRDTLQARVDQLTEQNRELLGALKGLVDSFVDLANSGDAGFFDADEQADVVAARAAIRKATGEEA